MNMKSRQLLVMTIRGKAMTFFFFSNFPDEWDEAKLSKLFRRHGKLFDVYLTSKINSWSLIVIKHIMTVKMEFLLNNVFGKIERIN